MKLGASLDDIVRSKLDAFYPPLAYFAQIRVGYFERGKVLPRKLQ